MKQHITKPAAVPAASRISTKMGPSTKPKMNPIMNRCTHRFAASGRQCRLLTSDPSALCSQHLLKTKVAAQSADYAAVLFRRSQDFQNAQGINHSLLQLYELLARDQISVRRAQTLAYITSLILRTLPAIDYDRARGVREDSESTRAKPSSDERPAADNSASDEQRDPADAAAIGSADDSPAGANAAPASTRNSASAAAPNRVSASAPSRDAAPGPSRVSPADLAAAGSAIPDPPPHTKPS